MTRHDDPAAHGRDRAARAGAAGLVCGAVALVCLLLTALLGPSVMEPALPGAPGSPPYSLVLHPPPYVVIALTAAGAVLGALGLGLCRYAGRRGWRFGVRGLLIAGGVAAVAFMLMPPVGSADHLNYAAYGRMAVTGNDPYATGAADLPADPVTRSVEDWRDTPTVYGPIATAQQAFASLIGGESVRLTVFVLSVTNAAAFLAVGLLLHRAARGDPGRELRAALLWTANPLMLFALVAGAHNDVLAIAFATAGLLAFGGPERPRPEETPSAGRGAVAGILVGVGAAIKINVAIVGGGPAWVLLRDRWARRGAAAGRSAGRRLAALFAAAGLVTGMAYLIAGPHSLEQLRRASKSVSLATPWHLVAGYGGGLLVTVPRVVVQAGSLVLTIGLAALLLLALPRPRVRPLGDTSREDAIRVSAALVLAWLFAVPYALPWYDGLGWALIALLPWSRFDWLLLARTTALALAYLPARGPSAAVPSGLSWLTTVLRAQVIPWTLALILTVLVVLAAGRARRSSARGRTRRAPVESPR